MRLIAGRPRVPGTLTVLGFQIRRPRSWLSDQKVVRIQPWKDLVIRRESDNYT